MKAHAAAWVSALDEDDLQLLKRLLLSSGSLKELATQYKVSYPTLRTRLNRLIEKVQAVEDPAITDPFQRRLKMLVADGDMPPALAKELFDLHRASAKKRPAKR
jgi:hypothetical protein